MIGYLPCRSCGSETNVSDLTSKLCPACRRKRAADLSGFQRQYEQAVRKQDASRAAALAKTICAYQQAEGVRLLDIPDAYRVR